MSFNPIINESYYGWVINHREYVRLIFFENGSLGITALSHNSVQIPNERWCLKRALLGEGKIHFTVFAKETPHPLVIRIYPWRERVGQQEQFLAKRNGPWNPKSDLFFSTIVENSDDQSYIPLLNTIKYYNNRR